MASEQPPIACPELLLRGIKRKYLQAGSDGSGIPLVHHEAFALREGEEYLSVDRLALTSVADSFARWPPNLRAAMSLHTGRVRDAGLQVEPKERDTPSNPAHAGICGLPSPFGTENEYHRAMAAALVLREMARFVASRDA